MDGCMNGSTQTLHKTVEFISLNHMDKKRFGMTESESESESEQNYNAMHPIGDYYTNCVSICG